MFKSPIIFSIGAAILIALPLSAAPRSVSTRAKKERVAATTALVLRASPSARSRRRAGVRRGERLWVLARGKSRVVRDGLWDHWYKVRNSQRITGWVYGADLRFPAPSRWRSPDFDAVRSCGESGLDRCLDQPVPAGVRVWLMAEDRDDLCPAVATGPATASPEDTSRASLNTGLRLSTACAEADWGLGIVGRAAAAPRFFPLTVVADTTTVAAVHARVHQSGRLAVAEVETPTVTRVTVGTSTWTWADYAPTGTSQRVWVRLAGDAVTLDHPGQCVRLRRVFQWEGATYLWGQSGPCASDVAAPFVEKLEPED